MREAVEGWIPELAAEEELREALEKAFDYRGNVTVVRTDGSETEGYMFNRNADASVPFVQMFDASGGGPHTIAYREIRTIRFTGRDTAAGNSYAAWLRAKEAAKAGERPEKGSGSASARGV